MKVVPPFNPRIPTTDPEAQEFGRNTADFLNKPIRNEVTFSVVVPEAPSSLALWSSGYSVTVSRAGWSPFRDGFVLRRVRMVKVAASGKSAANRAGVALRALIQTSDRAIEVGAFSTFDYAMVAGRSRNISGIKDIEKPMPAGSMIVVEATYTGVPPILFGDATILFDFGVT